MSDFIVSMNLQGVDLETVLFYALATIIDEVPTRKYFLEPAEFNAKQLHKEIWGTAGLTSEANCGDAA